MHVAETDRRRQDGLWLTKKQFVGALAAILSAQIAVNVFAVKSFIREVAIESVKIHNTDAEAHARALLVAQHERTEMIKQIVVLQTKVDGLTTMIRDLADAGAFNVPRKK